MVSQASHPTLEDLDRLLHQIEVPACGCSFKPKKCSCRSRGVRCYCPPLYPPPCPHVRAVWHHLTPGEWYALLARAYPTEYATPKPASAPVKCLTREARIAVMAMRFSRGEALKHPGDLYLDETDSHLGRHATERICNGHDSAAEYLVTDYTS